MKALVARHFGISPSKVRLDDSFVGELGGDALDLVELGWEIEAAFDGETWPCEQGAGLARGQQAYDNKCRRRSWDGR